MEKNSPLAKCRKKILLIFPVFLVLCSCSMLRQMPIQMARSAQIDFYKQFYRFGENADIAKVEKIIGKLMGSPTTWENFLRKYPYKPDELLQHIKNRRLYVQGTITLTTYLNPKDHDQLFVDGNGRYAVIFLNDHNENDVLFTADYFVKSIPFSIKNDILHKQLLKVKISQVLIRHFTVAGAANVNHVIDDIPLYFGIKLEQLGNSGQVFRIKYENEDGTAHEHTVFFDDQKIGYMVFDKLPFNNAKVFDVRGRKFLRKDY